MPRLLQFIHGRGVLCQRGAGMNCNWLQDMSRRQTKVFRCSSFSKMLDQKTFYFACGSILATNPNHKKEDSRPFSQNRLSSVADVCASPEAQGMDILDNISHGGVFSRYIAQNLYGRKNFRYNLISFSKTAAYSFAPISACISISTSCVGRFSSLMPIQVQHGRLSLKNSE